jgi:hypothetical protein
MNKSESPRIFGFDERNEIIIASFDSLKLGAVLRLWRLTTPAKLVLRLSTLWFKPIVPITRVRNPWND